MAGEIPKLWSKLEDAGDVTSPDLGTGEEGKILKNHKCVGG